MRALFMVAVVFVTSFGTEGVAQTSIQLAVEGRVALAFPAGTWGEERRLSRGLGYGANAQLWRGHVGLYAGWDKFHFAVLEREWIDVADYSVSDDGFRGGAMAALPVSGRTSIAPFMFTGAIYNRSKSRRTLVEIITDDRNGGREFGFEIGGGVTLLRAEKISFTPALRYRSHPTAYVGFTPAGGAPATTAYWILDMGILTRIPFSRGLR